MQIVHPVDIISTGYVTSTISNCKRRKGGITACIFLCCEMAKLGYHSVCLHHLHQILPDKNESGRGACAAQLVPEQEFGQQSE